MKWLLLLTLLYSLPVRASDVDVRMCGTKVSWLENFFTHANDIRVKCIEQAYEANKKKLEAELEQLQKTQQQLAQELKKYAYKVDYNIVRCDPTQGQPANPQRTAKCRELIRAENAIIDRIDEIMGWRSKPLPPNRSQVSNAEVTPPCPSKERLEQIQAIRYFNPGLYKTWERCVMLQPENYY